MPRPELQKMPARASSDRFVDARRASGWSYKPCRSVSSRGAPSCRLHTVMVAAGPQTKTLCASTSGQRGGASGPAESTAGLSSTTNESTDTRSPGSKKEQASAWSPRKYSIATAACEPRATSALRRETLKTTPSLYSRWRSCGRERWSRERGRGKARTHVRTHLPPVHHDTSQGLRVDADVLRQHPLQVARHLLPESLTLRLLPPTKKNTKCFVASRSFVSPLPPFLR